MAPHPFIHLVVPEFLKVIVIGAVAVLFYGIQAVVRVVVKVESFFAISARSNFPSPVVSHLFRRLEFSSPPSFEELPSPLPSHPRLGVGNLVLGVFDLLHGDVPVKPSFCDELAQRSDPRRIGLYLVSKLVPPALYARKGSTVLGTKARVQAIWSARWRVCARVVAAYQNMSLPVASPSVPRSKVKASASAHDCGLNRLVFLDLSM